MGPITRIVEKHGMEGLKQRFSHFFSRVSHLSQNNITIFLKSRLCSTCNTVAILSFNIDNDKNECLEATLLRVLNFH